MRPITGWTFLDASGEIADADSVIVHRKRNASHFESIIRLNRLIGKDLRGPVKVTISLAGKVKKP